MHFFGGGGGGEGLRAKSDLWSWSFLAETVKTGAKYRNVSYNIFKTCRLFWERVGPPILSSESVDYFTTSVSGWRKKEPLWAKRQGNFDGEADWSGVVKSMQLFAATIKMTCYVLHVFALCQWYIFSRIERWFSYICTRVFNQFRNNKIVENYVNGKYRKEHSTVDKVGCRKLVARKSCFGVELVSS